jgi:hypothetical protein
MARAEHPCQQGHCLVWTRSLSGSSDHLSAGSSACGVPRKSTWSEKVWRQSWTTEPTSSIPGSRPPSRRTTANRRRCGTILSSSPSTPRRRAAGAVWRSGTRSPRGVSCPSRRSGTSSTSSGAGCARRLAATRDRSPRQVHPDHADLAGAFPTGAGPEAPVPAPGPPPPSLFSVAAPLFFRSLRAWWRGAGVKNRRLRASLRPGETRTRYAKSG